MRVHVVDGGRAAAPAGAVRDVAGNTDDCAEWVFIVHLNADSTAKGILAMHVLIDESLVHDKAVRGSVSIVRSLELAAAARWDSGSPEIFRCDSSNARHRFIPGAGIRTAFDLYSSSGGESMQRNKAHGGRRPYSRQRVHTRYRLVEEAHPGGGFAIVRARNGDLHGHYVSGIVTRR